MIYILLALFVLMWIVLIVPRQREMRRHRELVANLAVGDEVMTSSGIYGTIRAVADDQVRLEVAPGLELRVAKRAVAAKVPEPVTPSTGSSWPEPERPSLAEGPPEIEGPGDASADGLDTDGLDTDEPDAGDGDDVGRSS